MSEEISNSSDIRTTVLVAVAVAGVYIALIVAKNFAYKSYLKARKN